MTEMGRLQRLAAGMIPQLAFPTTAAPPLPTAFSGLNLRSSTTMSTDTAHLDNIFKEKKALRTRVRKELKSMDLMLRSQEDDAIQSIILEAPWFKSCNRLCAYISCAALREVDTSKVLSAILKNTAQGFKHPALSRRCDLNDDDLQMRKKLYVPRVEDKNSFMRMLNITRMDDLIANSMDILEPAPHDAEGNERQDVMLADEPVDLFLLPGLAFDRSGRRMGRGGGYYDTFLTKYQELAKDRKWKKPLFVALSYSQQILEDGVIPVSPNDVPMDALVSSSGVIPTSPASIEMCL